MGGALRVALLGCGTVGSEVARLLTDARRRPGRPGGPRRSSWPASRSAGPPATAATCRSTPRCSPPTPRAWSGRDDVDVVVEVIGGIEPARSLILAALEAGSLGRHRQQGAARRGRRRPCSPPPRSTAADLYYEAAVAGAIPILRPLRESLAGDRVTPGARHRQRHHQLHPHPDERERRRLRRRARGGAGAGLRRGRPDRRRRGLRRRRQGGDPRRAGLPHPGHRRRRAPRGHHRGHRRRRRQRPRDGLRRQAARDRRGVRRRLQRRRAGAPGDDPGRPPAGRACARRSTPSSSSARRPAS